MGNLNAIFSRHNISNSVTATPAKETLDGNYLIQLFGAELYVSKEGDLLRVCHTVEEQWGEFLDHVPVVEVFFDRLPSREEVEKRPYSQYESCQLWDLRPLWVLDAMTGDKVFTCDKVNVFGEKLGRELAEPSYWGR